VSHQKLGKGSPQSMMIFVDEGEEADDDELQKTIELFRGDVTLLMIKVAMTEPKIRLYESYQLNNPETERMVGLVRDFSRANLKKKARKGKNTIFQKKMRINRKINVWQHEQHQEHCLSGYPLFINSGFSLSSINRSDFFTPYHIRRTPLANVTHQTGINLIKQNYFKVNRFNVNTEVIS